MSDSGRRGWLSLCAIIISFSVSETKPSGTLLDPPTQAQLEGHQEGEREDRDYRLVAGLVLLPDLLAEGLAEVVVAADPLAADEGLRGRVASVLRLERPGLLACPEMMILDRVALVLERILGCQALRAEMAGHNHRVETCGLWSGAMHGSA